MKFLSLEPFVPSGKDFEKSKELFRELGFKINWDAGDYTVSKETDANSFCKISTTMCLLKILCECSCNQCRRILERSN